MKTKILALLATLLLAALQSPAASNEEIPYPVDFRKWVHVKTTVIGPESKDFARNGGMHVFYANEKAVQGYMNGNFPDGAMLIDDLLEANQDEGYMSAGARKRVAVMYKQSEKFKDTKGWGYEIFPGDTQTPSLNAEGKAACFACHEKATSSVYSQFRK